MQALRRKSVLRPFRYGLAEYAQQLMLNGRVSLFAQMACLSPFYVKVKQHDAFSGELRAESQNVLVELLFEFAKQGADERGRAIEGFSCSRRILTYDSAAQRGEWRARDGTG
jgi:hypothetical protein